MTTQLKILLYEPGSAGHRPVILRYIEKSLTREGIPFVSVKEDLSGRPWKLVHLARANQCNVIHVLTADGIIGFIWAASVLARLFGIRTVCSYYLYNNLRYGWRAAAWRLVLCVGGPRKVLISDEYIVARKPTYPAAVHYVPDPWDAEEFVCVDRNEARSRLKIDNGRRVFLIFGHIDARKGCDLVLDAMREFSPVVGAGSLLILCAGRVDSDYMNSLKSRLVDGMLDAFRFDDRFIEECEVGLYFSAADFVLCPYPRWFKVSSGTATRALAAGRPLIVPSHGMLGEFVRREKCGLVYHTESAESLRSTIAQALDMDLVQMQNLCSELALPREANRFGAAVIAAYA